MFGIGHTEIIVVAIVAMLLFGPTMMPRLARSLGDTIKEFRGSMKEINDINKDLK